MSAPRLSRGGKGGEVIHLTTCRYAKWPWPWAEGRPDEEWLVKAWLKPCRKCLPDLAALQDEIRARAVAALPGTAGSE